MRRIYLVGLIAFALSFGAQTGYANVFAAHLGPEPGNGGTQDFGVDSDMDISYRLNEAATSVTIEIFETSSPGVTVKTLSGTTDKGLNTVQWYGQKDGGGPAADGTYSFKITAADSTGHASWEKISVDDNNENKYYSPKGLVCSIDEASEYFGCVYVSEAMGGTTGGRTTTDGLYVCTNDIEDAVAQGDTGLGGGIDWATGGSSSPYRIELDDAGKIYLADWSDSHSGVWRCNNGDGSGSFDTILTEAGRDGSGVCTNHGSISEIWVEGSDASMKLYTRDEDLSMTGENTGSVIEYAVGTATNYSATPATVVANDGGYTVNSTNGLVKDPAGDWWLSQYRWTQSGTEPWVWRIDGTTGLVTYHSANDGGITQRIYGGGAGISPDGSTLAFGGYAGVCVFDYATLTQTAALVTGSSNRDCSFDAAGNLCIVNSSDERLLVYSPPDGSNNYETTYYGNFGVSNATRVDDWGVY